MELNEMITVVNDWLWNHILIVALIGCGLWFTWRTRFVQFRMVGEMFRLLTDSAVSTVSEQVKEKKGRYAFRLLDDYRTQKRQGIKEPTFHRSQFPELEAELECWE